MNMLDHFKHQADKYAERTGKDMQVIFDTRSGAYSVFPTNREPDEIFNKCVYRTDEREEEIMINELVEKAHETAKAKGWWQEPKSIGDIIALCHCELSETMEQFRDGHKPNETYYNDKKPEGIPTELADVIIRIMDYCGHEGIDLEKAITEKMAYNETRPFRHGGKVI